MLYNMYVCRINTIRASKDNNENEISQKLMLYRKCSKTHKRSIESIEIQSVDTYTINGKCLFDIVFIHDSSIVHEYIKFTESVHGFLENLFESNY